MKILVECGLCKKKRLVRLLNGSPRSHICRKCASKMGARKRYKGGRHIGASGYIVTSVYPSFFKSMANKEGYILEHRLVMAKSLSRCLLPWEVVHHKNGNKTDNRIDNLQLLMSHNDHTKLHRALALSKVDKAQ